MSVVSSGKKRSARIATLPSGTLVALTVSQVFFVFGLTVPLIVLWGGDMLVSYFGHAVLKGYLALAVASLLISYLIFRRIKEVGFVDFLVAMIFSGELRRLPHGRAIDSGSAQLFLGLIFFATTPFVYILSGSSFVAAAWLTISGLLIAGSFVAYSIAGII